MAGDWIKLHRRSLDSQVFSDDFLWRLWCYCLMRANYRPRYFQGQLIPRGSFVTSRRTIAADLRCSPSKAYRGLATLEGWGQIHQVVNSKWTTLTICNYDSYQDDDEKSEPRVNHEWTTSEPRVNTREEYKEGKEVQENPPNPPRGKRGGGIPAEWKAAIDALAAAGIRDALQLAKRSRRRGMAADELLAALTLWKGRRPAWGPGAVAWAVDRWQPGDDPTDPKLWPSPDPAAARKQPSPVVLRGRRITELQAAGLDRQSAIEQASQEFPDA